MFVNNTGMVSAVGLHAAAASAAIRAGISKFDELPYLDALGEPVVGAAIPGLDMQFGPRLVAMLVGALRDCIDGLPGHELAHVPLIVGLTEPGRPGGCPGLARTVLDDVSQALGRAFHPKLSRVIPSGHTAGFDGLAIARQLLQAERIPGCIVCGVDSFINASSLMWLDANWRLKRGGHLDGAIPGEAAAAVYVQLRPSPCDRAAVQVAGLGYGQETATILAEEPLQGLGLAAAARQAFAEAGCGFHDIDFRLSDVTGENYGFREHVLAEAKLARTVRKTPQPLWHPSECIGDSGAAAGVVQLVLAKAAWSKSYAPGPCAACFTSSVSGRRAVAVLRGPWR